MWASNVSLCWDQLKGRVSLNKASLSPKKKTGFCKVEPILKRKKSKVTGRYAQKINARSGTTNTSLPGYTSLQMRE